MSAPEAQEATPPEVAWLMAPSNDLYGSSQTLLAVARALRERGTDVHVLLSSDGPLTAAAVALGARVHAGPLAVLRRGELRRTPLASSWRLAADLAASWRWFGSLPAPTLVHGFCLPTVAVLLARGRWRAATTGWSVHELPGGRVAAALFRLLVRRVDYRVACSAHVRDRLGLRPDECSVVHSGVTLPEADPSLPAPVLPRRHPGSLAIVCVGRINSWKGQDIAVRALAALVREQHVCAELFLVGGVHPGDEPVRSALLALVEREGVADRVHLLGERPQGWRYMGGADVVVVPSKKPEPFGKVVVEAMLQGVAVVATCPGGPAEVITDGVDGVLVPTGDVHALQLALAALAAPERRAALGRQARSTSRSFDEAGLATGYLRAVQAARSRR